MSGKATYPTSTARGGGCPEGGPQRSDECSGVGRDGGPAGSHSWCDPSALVVLLASTADSLTFCPIGCICGAFGMVLLLQWWGFV